MRDRRSWVPKVRTGICSEPAWAVVGSPAVDTRGGGGISPVGGGRAVSDTSRRTCRSPRSTLDYFYKHRRIGDPLKFNNIRQRIVSRLFGREFSKVEVVYRVIGDQPVTMFDVGAL